MIGKRKTEEPDKEIEYRKVGDKTYRVVYEVDDELHHVKTFVDKYERGKLGKNKSIPMGFNRLTKFIGLRRQVFYLVGGYTGSGKTTFVDDAFVLNPADWFLNINTDPDIDFKVIYFSQERSKDYKIARWLSRKIFLETSTPTKPGVIIPIDHILGWQGAPTYDEQVLIDKYLPYINKILDKVVTLIENPINPTGVYKKLKEFALSRGREEEVIVIRRNKTEYTTKIYIANNPSEIVLIVLDTINISKSEREYDEINGKKVLVKSLNDKEVLDKMSEYLRWGRDYLGYSPVPVSQFNRSISNPIRIKNGDVQPQLEDFKGSGDSQEDAEVVLALFDPIRYKVDDVFGYKLSKLKEGLTNRFPGSKKYRQLSILKNSYGPDDMGVGLAYQPQVGLFKELPFSTEMTDEDYESVLDNTFFGK